MNQDFREVSPQLGYAGFLAASTQGSESAQLSDAELRSLSPLALAYIGDAVYELFVRSRLLMPPRQVRAFHREVVEHVRAEQQADFLNGLKPYLNEAEMDILRRARNAASGRKTRASLRDYRQATALEALLGYLYLTDSLRLLELLALLPIPLRPEAAPS